ncbi:diguanylate cyclase [bacterium]|nr:diguanylate cyclase [bacterium]
MKQQQFIFKSESELESELKKILGWYQSGNFSALLIRIYTELLDQSMIEKTSAKIGEILPEALIVGCSSYGNIVNGDFSGGSVAVICTAFECPSTKIEILQYPLCADSQIEVTEKLCEEVIRRPWVKGVELLVTIRGMSVTALCEGLSELPDGVQVFGGGAFCQNLEHNDACVFSSAGSYQEKGIVFILFGGEDLRIESTFLTGWKPVGQYLDVTAADGPILKELNGKPAYDTYYKYLHIKNDENFFFNTLEFPFLYRYNGLDIMRAPTASNPDGSLTMTADISKGVSARIAYGDPWTILSFAWQQGNELLQFAPECISVFSCAARRTFWGDTDVGKETEPYQAVAPTSGFYTSGEFLRTNGLVNQHNVTQVIAAMREGPAKPHPAREIAMASHKFEGKISMINRMATFIKATTEELMEANRRLKELSVTDAMTGVKNKTAYYARMEKLDAEIQDGFTEFAMAVFDLNGLKEINDSLGHEAGDRYIKKACKIICSKFKHSPVYRMGGDEFVAILEGEDFERREELLSAFEKQMDANLKQGKVSIASGYSSFDPAQDKSYHTVMKRADNNMYQRKRQMKEINR